MNGKYWSAIFWAAAIFNFLAGLPPLLVPEMVVANAELPPFAPEHLLIVRMSGLLICTFGIGYAMVALGWPGTRQIVALGLIGKLGLCFLVALQFAQTGVSATVIGATAGDFIFVVLFALYLSRTGKAPA
ncbi:MAG: hypothetical protein WD034_02025 [Parvibaculum sp.]|uniref:hypothetical protein n=1 Tax=Parvibaculum sp. TaxID=2024848 RepID=UPI0034A0749D